MVSDPRGGVTLGPYNNNPRRRRHRRRHGWKPSRRSVLNEKIMAARFSRPTAESAWRRRPAERSQWLRPIDAARLARALSMRVVVMPDGTVEFDGTAQDTQFQQKSQQHHGLHGQQGGRKKFEGASPAGLKRGRRQADGLPSRMRDGVETNTHEAFSTAAASEAVATMGKAAVEMTPNPTARKQARDGVQSPRRPGVVRPGAAKRAQPALHATAYAATMVKARVRVIFDEMVAGAVVENASAAAAIEQTR